MKSGGESPCRVWSEGSWVPQYRCGPQTGTGPVSHAYVHTRQGGAWRRSGADLGVDLEGRGEEREFLGAERGKLG